MSQSRIRGSCDVVLVRSYTPTTRTLGLAGVLQPRGPGLYSAVGVVLRSLSTITVAIRAQVLRPPPL